MSIVIPAIIYTFINILIFIHVRSSSRRVKSIPLSLTANNTRTSQQLQPFANRDIHLLLYMMYTLTIFIMGWFPYYLSLILWITKIFVMQAVVYTFLTIWAEASLIILIVMLFIYNKKLRELLKQKFCRCCS